MKEKLVIIGAGGHAKSVIDLIDELNQYDIIGCIDSVGESVSQYSIIGTDDDLISIFQQGVTKAFIALGDNKLRKKLTNVVEEIGFECITVISKDANISSKAKVGSGTVIMRGASLNTGSTIGRSVIVNTNASIDHDTVIENYCHIAPGVAISGFTTIAEGTSIGTGASVKDRVNIGAWSVFGVGSVIINDFGDFILAYGVPARIIRKDI